MKTLIQYLNDNLATENLFINFKSTHSGVGINLSNIKIDFDQADVGGDLYFKDNGNMVSSKHPYYQSIIRTKFDSANRNTLSDYMEQLKSISMVWKYESAYFLLNKEPYSFRNKNVFAMNGYYTRVSDTQNLSFILGFDYGYHNIFSNIVSLITYITTLINFPTYTPVELLHSESVYNNLDKSVCAPKHQSTIFVVRNLHYFGHFVLDNTNEFSSCSKSNYLVTSLMNAFNERYALYTSQTSTNGWAVVTRYIHTTLPRCKYCNETYLPNVEDTENKNYCSHCNDKINEVISTAGVSKDYVLGKHKVLSYDDNPTPKFLQAEKETNPLYLGVELEVDRSSEEDEEDEESDDSNGLDKDLSADVVLQQISPLGYVYAKHDGSLRNGFEIVSHPVTLEKHLELGWDNGMKALTRLGYNSHNTDTCGLHIHISREFFGKSHSTQMLNGGKIAYLMEKHWDNFVKFTRRKVDKLERWSALRRMFDTSFKISTLNVENTAKTKMLKNAFSSRYDYRSKYVALNTMHSNTFEFRIFRGSTNTRTFKATLQFVDNLARLVKKTKIDKIDDIAFADIINYRRHSELNQYYHNRFVTNSMVME